MATNDDLKNLLLEIKADVSGVKQSLLNVEVDIANLKCANEKVFSGLEDCKVNCRDLVQENSRFKKRLD